MPYLGIATSRLTDRLGSPATNGEGRQNLLCAYFAAALLVRLLANAASGASWPDPGHRAPDRRRRREGECTRMARRGCA